MAFTIILIISYSTTVNAEASEENFKLLLNDIQKNIFPLVIADRPHSERLRTQDVKVVFVTDFYGRNVAAANSDTKEIIISSGFMWGIWLYSEATVIEGYTENEHFREWYFHYLLWRHPTYWNGDIPVQPAEFFGLNEEETNKAINNSAFPVSTLFTLAIIDVLLHELGHIALDATYEESSSNAYKIAQEIRADNWAIEAGRSLDDTSGLGKLISIGYINELERFYGFKKNIYATHPTTQSRFKFYVEQWCSLANVLSDKVCLIYEKEYERTFSTDNLLMKYQAREQKGEAHAAIKLGDFYMEGHVVAKDIPKACNYYKKSYELGDLNVGALNYGWCLIRGYFGTENKVKGDEILRFLEEKGWLYAGRLRGGT
ncbi:hypothetical protein [Rheinheimera faecalis]|uniref:hypothetical protein n=1 Tax=Rheinheimera faecalis TaxID=2901141 RepID=UPI001E2B81E2|nr:hypothetical protein [Rheinheimera faecalis]